MATTRALLYFIQRSSLLRRTVQMTPIKSNLYLPLSVITANYSDKKSALTKSKKSNSGGQVQIGFAESVKKNTVTAYYLAVIIFGVGVTVIMFYTIYQELFSEKGPTKMFNRTFDRVSQDNRVRDALGAPVNFQTTGYRAGHRHLNKHILYEKNGVPHLRMKFNIVGSASKRGTVHAEVREDSNGNWVYRYLFVQLNDFARSVIVLEDNRILDGDKDVTHNELNEKLSSEFNL